MKNKAIFLGASLLCLVGLFITFFWSTEPKPSSSSESRVNGANKVISSKEELYEAELMKAGEALELALKNRTAGGTTSFLISKTDAEKFLDMRGRTASSLMFISLVTEDDKWISELKLLPESRLSNIYLNRFSSNEKEKLKTAKFVYESNPESLFGKLMYAEALSRAGKEIDAGTLVTEIFSHQEPPNPKDFGTTALREEFEYAFKVFGDEVGGDILENHGQKWSSQLIFDYQNYFLDAKFQDISRYNDFENFEKDVSLATTFFLQSAGTAPSEIDLSKLIHVREFIAYNRNEFQTESNKVEKTIEKLTEQGNIEFLNNLKRGANFYSSSRSVQLQQLKFDNLN